ARRPAQPAVGLASSPAPPASAFAPTARFATSSSSAAPPRPSKPPLVLNFPILWDSGVYLPEQRLWLDPKKPRPRAVISHAHSDHVANHALAYATPATRRLVTHRRPALSTVEAVPYGQPLVLDRCRVTFSSAGHVLG